MKDYPLTVLRNSNSFKKLEAILSLESRDLSVGEFCKKFWGQVGLTMLVVTGDFEGNTAEGSSGLDLNIASLSDSRSEARKEKNLTILAVGW